MHSPRIDNKPSKPYADFPLYAHRNGQWAKKIRGKTYFFGIWTDWESALTTYLVDRDTLQAGRQRKRRSDSPTLQELVNIYVDHCDRRVVSKELSQRTLNDYTRTLKRLALVRGKLDQPSDWTPEDFAAIKESFFQPVERVTPIRGGLKGISVDRRSSVTVDIDIRAIRAFLNWCYESEFITQPRFGRSFNQTSAKQKRMKKAELGPRDLTAVEIRSFVAHSSINFKGIVLLGINAGMGAADISSLKVESYSDAWLNCPRQKTGVARRIWLWPETRSAIDAQMAKRWKVRQEGLLFETSQGNPWVRDDFDAIGKLFGRLRDNYGLRGTFYDLRRTFETIAEDTLDFPAVKHCMGHAPSNSDMSAIYRQKVSDDRIRKVCEHVRNWLFHETA